MILRLYRSPQFVLECGAEFRNNNRNAQLPKLECFRNGAVKNTWES